MPRQLRLQFPGALYHALNRGDHREPIFRDDHDRSCFLATLGEACAKTAWQVHALCLMPNHFHLVLETPQANLVAGMRWLLSTYTSRFNHRHRQCGHLFSGRYKSLLVGGKGSYLRTVCEYVHLNPARAGLLSPGEPLRDYRWSSFPEYLKPAAQRPGWLRVDRVLGESGLERDTAIGRREFERLTEARRRQDPNLAFAGIRRGWFFGDSGTRRELLEQIAAEAGPQHYGAELAESEQAKTERILAEELARREWDEEELVRRRKGDPEKVAMALRLRRETTATLEWIAGRLRMGTRSYLAHLLYWAGRERAEKVHNTTD